MRRVLFEAGKTLSFMLSILSLFPIIVSAFFAPGTHWEERLSMAVLRVALAACVCFASGLLFAYSPGHKNMPLLQTLPVQMFLWTLAGAAVFFVISWYLETYYVPLLWRNQPRELGMFVLY